MLATPPRHRSTSRIVVRAQLPSERRHVAVSVSPCVRTFRQVCKYDPPGVWAFAGTAANDSNIAAPAIAAQAPPER
jgi:hypothetical protein